MKEVCCKRVTFFITKMEILCCLGLCFIVVAMGIGLLMHTGCYSFISRISRNEIMKKL